MREYARRLPHRHVLGQPLFVTFRLAGTLPANRVFPAVELTSGKAFVAMDRLLDTARAGPLFLKQPTIAALITRCLQDGQDRLRRYELHAFVVMPNHVHLLVTPLVDAENWMGPLKGFTARCANEILGRSGAFWQDESYDHLVRNQQEFERIRRYIEWNPVHAGLAASPGMFPWSSGAGFQPADPLSSGSSRPEGRLC